MTCHDFEARVVDRARGELHDVATDAALDDHLRHCPACAARFAREQRLTAGLRALAAGTASMDAPDRMEQALVAAFADRRAGGRQPMPAAGWKGLVAMAAMLAIAVAGAAMAWRIGDRELGPSGQVAQQPAPVSTESEFVPWPGAAALPPFESGQLVRTELPASVLPLLGIRPARAQGGNRVVADVLVGQDGLARAVRLAN
jgi:predicted anti-sigma-YlaC factor YlaD